MLINAMCQRFLFGLVKLRTIVQWDKKFGNVDTII